jgi:hypothetical protein
MLQLRQSKLGDATGNVSRDNIKMNTKNIMQEIGDLDNEIAQLQGTLLTALQPNISDPEIMMINGDLNTGAQTMQIGEEYMVADNNEDNTMDLLEDQQHVIIHDG